MKRLIDNYLDVFFAQNKKALLITGARQVGKTYSIRAYGKTHFKHFVEVNFIEDVQAQKLFAGANSAKDWLLRLSALSRQDLVPNETLIFFDEVQECPDLLTAIKFLVDDGQYRFILSGSLLGVKLKDWRSVPVGYMEIKEMYPMDLQEFMSAVGISEEVFATLRSCWQEKRPVDEFIHKKMMELVRLYLLVGGMPAAVQAYIDTNNLRITSETQRSIIHLYKKDIAKYDSRRKLFLEEIFSLIPPELNAKNKRFILKNLNENIKFSCYENSFLWLKNAGVALPVYNVEEPKMPLLLARSRSLFKLFQNDVGLLACQYAGDIQVQVLQGDTHINCGAPYENLVAQELQAHGFDLYYFNSKKQGEVDFLIENNGAVLPIEVKSGKDYHRHRALTNIMKCADYDLPQALILCNDNISVHGPCIYAPIYMLMFVRPAHTPDVVYTFTFNK